MSRFTRPLIFLVVALFVIVLVETAYLFAPDDQSLTSMARGVVDECAKAPYRPTCYEKEVPRLMKKISMEDAFKVTTLIQGIDTTYKYCHVLGHKLSAEETTKDPSQWTQVIQRCPSGVCSNGCIHGAFQERFRTEALTPEELEKFKPQFVSVCEKREGFDPTKLEQATCYHALGHLLMYVTSADIHKSLSLCKELTHMAHSDNYVQVCYDGAFMQIYQPLEPDDFALIKGKEVSKPDVKNFCGKFEGKEQSSCWSESWPLSKDEIKTPGGTSKFCGYLKSTVERKRCFEAVVYVMVSQLAFDEEKVRSFCSDMVAGDKEECFAKAASRFIETDYKNADASVRLCKASLTDEGAACFKELLKFSTYNFHPGSEAFISYCRAMPDPWREACLKGDRTKLQ